MIPRYETDSQGMKDSTRYEKCAQGIQQVHKGMNCFFRYETRVFLKNSGFSYLYGSISSLFGYEKNRCFFLMVLFTIDDEGVFVLDTGATTFILTVPTLTVPDRWIFPRIEGC